MKTMMLFNNFITLDDILLLRSYSFSKEKEYIEKQHQTHPYLCVTKVQYYFEKSKNKEKTSLVYPFFLPLSS